LAEMGENGRRSDSATFLFLLCSSRRVYARPMPDPEKLTPANPDDLASALAFALRFQGRKRVHNADELMAEIVAKRLIEPPASW
jgi:hypothetical protein